MTDDRAMLSPIHSRSGGLASPPWDRLAFVVVVLICAVGAALVGMIQFVYSPSVGVHLFVALPPVLFACLLPFWLVKRWLASDRFRFEADNMKGDDDRVREKPLNSVSNVVTLGAQPAHETL
ncbi:hypothetical protein [Neorhizobium sp. JUb45]|uniref:hypothetical protein n=1 Tax=unclassified Neorhizobium TaxID=2629175 RepID=UPI00104D7B08|nr:hypothetical protein [Neorhizobium sp. JUb45]TCQ97953.1 hypothetical protein EDF70_11219 [Neorhizobium sp. JUb45]